MSVQPNVRARPLAGRRIVITRAREQASRFRRLLEAAGAEVIEMPAIRIAPPESWDPLDAAIARLETFDWVIFTSVNGVESVRRRAALTGERAVVETLRRRRVAAIGPATASALEEWGVSPEVVPDEYRAEGLVERLRGVIRADDRVLLPRAAQTRDVLVKELERVGASVTEVPAYRTLPVNEPGAVVRRVVGGRPVDVVTFTSSSTVRHFLGMLSDEDQAALFGDETVVACIGPITADTAREFGLETRIMPSEYTIPTLANAIIDHFVAKKGVR